MNSFDNKDANLIEGVKSSYNTANMLNKMSFLKFYGIINQIRPRP